MIKKKTSTEKHRRTHKTFPPRDLWLNIVGPSRQQQILSMPLDTTGAAHSQNMIFTTCIHANNTEMRALIICISMLGTIGLYWIHLGLETACDIARRLGHVPPGHGAHLLLPVHPSCSVSARFGPALQTQRKQTRHTAGRGRPAHGSPSLRTWLSGRPALWICEGRPLAEDPHPAAESGAGGNTSPRPSGVGWRGLLGEVGATTVAL